MEGIISKKVDKWPLNIILFCFVFQRGQEKSHKLQQDNSTIYHNRRRKLLE